MYKYAFAVFLWICANVCVGSRILVVFPISGTNQVLGDSLAKVLLEAGHEVTYVSASRSKETISNLKHIDISSIERHLGRERINVLELVRNPKTSYDELKRGTNITHQVLNHPEFQELLNDPDEHFDVVVVQWSNSGLLAPLAAVFNCPLVWYSSEDVSWMTLRLIHFLTNPTYSVGPHSSGLISRSPTVTERARRDWDQLYDYVWTNYVLDYVEEPLYRQVYEGLLKVNGRLPTYESLVFNGSLLLINSHPLLGQLVPLPPSAKYVGGHHIQDSAKPLPKSFQALLDNSRNGIILLNLGARINSKDLPEVMFRGLVEILGQLEQTVIWITKYKLENLPRNVHIVNGVPHQSILSHNNTMMMITAGEIVTYTECLYFGIPVIGIPFFSDQFATTNLIADRGRGVAVHFDEEFPSRVKEAIYEILGNYSYSHNVKQASKIFRNSLVPPKQELLYWIEMVVSSAGAIHLRSPAVQLSFVEMLHLDTIVVAVLVVWFLTKVVKLVKVLLQDDDDLEKKNQ